MFLNAGIKVYHRIGKNMAYAVKINTKRQAWELGAGSAMEQEMIECGEKIR